jgi:hypothetical protein
MVTPFEKWWFSNGVTTAIQKKIINDPVEVARLAYHAGLYTSPPALNKEHGFDFKSHFLKCECGCQVMEIERYDYKDGDQGFNFTIWNRGRDGKRIVGWKEKFRWCWRIIKTGNPWADDIIATNQNARGVAEFILQNLPHEEPKD